MPHVTLNEVDKLSMLRVWRADDIWVWVSVHGISTSIVEHDEALVDYQDIYSTQLEKPRYVIFTLQTNRKNNMITHKISTIVN